jgi:hypothetical protein
MLRIAAVVALMATPAWAGESSLSGGDWACNDSGQCSPTWVTPSQTWQPPGVRPFPGEGTTSAPLATLLTGTNTSLETIPSSPPPPPICKPGWTAVDVASGTTIVHKCAAVGDLRDPE